MPDLTLDEISGLGLALRQMRTGHRVGADAVLLAAAAGPAARRIADVGAGVGAVGLALARRWPQAEVDLVEIDPDLAELARENAERHGLAARARIRLADVTDARARRAAGLADGIADLVVTNPPFLEAGSARASPDARRALAHVLAPARDGDPLALWLRASLALLAPKGRFVMIHRADALPAIYAALGQRLGGVAVQPIHPREGEDAIRVLVSGVKGSRAPARLLPGLVLHESDGRFTPLAQAIHRGEARLD